jgi:LPS sulfotransferase NodH
MALVTKAMRRLSLYATLASHRMLGLLGHRDYVQFFVLTRSRTGSNLLLSFLNSHPSIFCEGEIFAKMNGADPVSRLRRAYGKQPRHIRAKGFKIFYYHPLDADAADFWGELERRTDIRIIHLTRDNMLRTLLSRKIAGVRGSWTGTRFDAADQESKRITVSAEELADGFKQTREWEQAATARFASHPVLRMSYEDLVRSPQDFHMKLCRFLGVSPGRPSTDLSQQNPESLRELIRNYDDLKAHFAGSPWARFFED